MEQESTVQHETLFGHPVGLYTLFFAEMWERFSYYGMRALLVLYMIKGFLHYSDDQAYGVYGAYTALVYATGFVGGLFADRLLGQRRAVILGGLLMAGGHLMMTIPGELAFYHALALLIVGNGFFKPNISTMVGKLYPQNSPRRDGGFTIFYMGVNLGATLSPLLCGYVGERYGWHLGFGLATIGMLAGLAVFVLPTRATQAIVMGGAVATAISMLFLQNNIYQLVVNLAAGAALLVAGVISCMALNRGGVPATAGQPPDKEKLNRMFGPIRADIAVYLGVLVSVPIFALLVGRNVLAETLLYSLGAVCFAWLILEAVRRPKIERERLYVILILTFFSMLFWAFFEQAGSSLNNFADRNIDRVMEARTITTSDVGTELRFRIAFSPDDPEIAKLPLLNQEQLGMINESPEMAEKISAAIRVVEADKTGAKKLTAEKLDTLISKVTAPGGLNLSGLSYLQDAAGRKDASPDLQSLNWRIAANNVGMGVGGAEVAASIFQSANAGCILLFGLVFTMLWSFLGTHGFDPSTPVKFALGILQLGLGFAALWYGAQQADARGMVAVTWLLLGYLLHTTGELCLSPVGLSMVTKLSPRLIVSTAMGAWFMATGIANNLAGKIAKLTSVSQEGGGPQIVPTPSETVNLYGSVFGQIAIAAIVAAIICFALAPLLTKWMHTEVEGESEV